VLHGTPDKERREEVKIGWCFGNPLSPSTHALNSGDMKYSIKQDGSKPNETADSMLEGMVKSCIFSVVKGDGWFEVDECCDNYFRVYLTPEQLRALGEELVALSKT
jgi:hypothetical protein